MDLLARPTLLPADPGSDDIAAGRPAAAVAANHPASLLAWSLLATEALDAGRPVDAYAYARTGYHRGLDALRRSGWKGSGPVPWSHEPNRGFLRSLYALGAAARSLGEEDEATRCTQFLDDSDPGALSAIETA
jgi:hypothetical protein